MTSVMLLPSLNNTQIELPVIRRVRAILLTRQGHVLFIKRIKPDGVLPYWIAPGGGVEAYDATLEDALHREVFEELGATIEVLESGFVLRHIVGDKNLEEHFFICRLVTYDLALRHGPEFSDPARGEYIPEEIPLTAGALSMIFIKTPQLAEWLLEHLDYLRELVYPASSNYSPG